MQYYDKAIELDATNITFLTNKAAVFFELERYDESIQLCQQAIEIGREYRADYQLIAKALARIGNAYLKQEDLTNALLFYNKSLAENRTQEITERAKQVEKIIKEKERLAYINPELALHEKQLGNQCFQKGDYPTALKHYTEAIKRNPNDAKIYSNRAACYTKLAEFMWSIRDCDECLRLDPAFVKGYLRKGSNLVFMKRFAEAADVYRDALTLSPNCEEALEGYKKCMTQAQDPELVWQRAMADPEVQAILSDPAMQIILEQIQKDWKAAQVHLKNPDIQRKLQKLYDSGLLAIR